MEQFLRKYHKLFFLGLAAFLLYPAFQGGYIFLLDWAVTPNLSWADINFRLDSLTTIAARIFSLLFSFAVWQRIFLLGIIFFLGLGGFRLAQKTGNIYAQYFSGLFLIFNPFIYARLMEQPGIAAGSAAFFWFFIFLLEFLQERKGWKMIGTSVCAGLAVSFFPHSLFFIFLSTFLILGWDFFQNRDGKLIVKNIFFLIAAVLAMNANWIASSFFNVGENRSRVVESFTLQDVEAFATRAIGGHSVYATVLALQGYWGEYQDRFVSVQDNILWSFAFVLILGLSIFGAVKSWKKRLWAQPLAIMFLLAFVLAVGTASSFLKPIIWQLYQNIPLYMGLREPQKWAAVLVFVYAYFGAWGIKHVLEMKSLKNYRNAIGISCAVLPIVFSFSIISGMHAHMTPHRFPAEWQEAKRYASETSEGKILFFPWHSYLRLDFAGKNVVNPAKAYFGKNMIQGNNTEFGGVYSHSQDEETLAVEKYALKKNASAKNISYETFAADMRARGISMVMLAKTEDWQDYLWLDTIEAEKVLENDKLIIYKLQ
ncbi:MAG: hypothetical protein ACD_15C00212G0016 [uncultured bacterium]|nr:MAG: hypothetical protein ACD_15C00212G0016 [uncultured bacterium]